MGKRDRDDGDTSLGTIVDVLNYSWIPGGSWDVRGSGENTIYATFKVSVRADNGHCSGICIRDEILRINGIERITKRMVQTLRKNNLWRHVHLVFYAWEGWTFTDLDELDLSV